jgi:hypothetical protein
MTQEQRELLFKDLSGRLPYDVKVQYVNNIFVIDYISSYEEVKLDMTDNYVIDISEVKPYLFPMSSMTEEQKKYINDRWGINENFDFEIDPNWGKYFVDLGDAVDFIEWLNENYFDYRGLIPLGMAIDATNKKIY